VTRCSVSGGVRRSKITGRHHHLEKTIRRFLSVLLLVLLVLLVLLFLCHEAAVVVPDLRVTCHVSSCSVVTGNHAKCRN
jgi:hypothetical protein